MVQHRWARPQWLGTVDSTNRVVLEDPSPGRVVVADHQSQGQGRRGRTWTAPPGTSLAVSVAVPSPSRDRLGWVPLVAGLAAAHAVAQCSVEVETGLKWPNDVLITGPGQGEPGKVCGILAAARPGAVIVGAGLNIDQTRQQLPTAAATSWALAAGRPLPRDIRRAWLSAYLDCLAELLDQLSAGSSLVQPGYRRACVSIGQEVRVELPGGTAVYGWVRDVDDHGALVVDTDRGARTFHAGDIIHLRPR